MITLDDILRKSGGGKHPKLILEIISPLPFVARWQHVICDKTGRRLEEKYFLRNDSPQLGIIANFIAGKDWDEGDRVAMITSLADLIYFLDRLVGFEAHTLFPRKAGVKQSYFAIEVE